MEILKYRKSHFVFILLKALENFREKYKKKQDTQRKTLFIRYLTEKVAGRRKMYLCLCVYKLTIKRDSLSITITSQLYQRSHFYTTLTLCLLCDFGKQFVVVVPLPVSCCVNLQETKS